MQPPLNSTAANTACLHTYVGANIAKVDAAELDRARRAESSDAHVAALLGCPTPSPENAGDVDDVDLKTARAEGA